MVWGFLASVWVTGVKLAETLRQLLMLGLILIFLPFHFRLCQEGALWDHGLNPHTHCLTGLPCSPVRWSEPSSASPCGRGLEEWLLPIVKWELGLWEVWRCGACLSGALSQSSSFPILTILVLLRVTVGKAPAMKSIFNSYHLLHIYGLELGLHHSLALLLPPYPFLLPHQTPASPFPTLSRYFPG